MKEKLITLLDPKSGSRLSFWLAIVLVSGFVAFYWDHRTQKANQAPTEPESEETASTFIPDGFVLVPIEVANYESLDSILGKFGVVDLYLPPTDPKGKAIKVAERIRILRAPLNPSHFAVLAPESESARLVRAIGPFTVVVQNPGKSGTKFVNTPLNNPLSKKKTSRIQIESKSGARDDDSES